MYPPSDGRNRTAALRTPSELAAALIDRKIAFFDNMIKNFHLIWIHFWPRQKLSDILMDCFDDKADPECEGWREKRVCSIPDSNGVKGRMQGWAGWCFDMIWPFSRRKKTKTYFKVCTSSVISAGCALLIHPPSDSCFISIGLILWNKCSGS